jgi:membrane fusion protein
MNDSFFRPEVLAAQNKQWLGSVVLTTPLSFFAFLLFSVGCVVLVSAFLCICTYTKFVRVSGIITPERGVLKVMAQQQGVVIERRVFEGQNVKQGDLLLVLSTDKIMQNDSNTVETNAAIQETIGLRHKSISDERVANNRISVQQREQIANKVASLKAESAQLSIEISTIKARVDSARSQLNRYKEFVDQKFFSPAALQQKNDELLDQQARLNSLERSRIILLREVSLAQNEFQQLGARVDKEDAQIERSLAETKQASIAIAAQRKSAVVAPVDGVVTTVIADIGTVTNNLPLLTILPAGSQMEAQLYVPGSAIGYVEKGQKVKLRYASFPFQDFGQYEGIVKEVSRAPLNWQELPSSAGNVNPSLNGESLYPVSVAIPSQYVLRDGKKSSLIVGSQVDAQVVQETRTLIRWLFAPLFRAVT